jgi:citrate synthase
LKTGRHLKKLSEKCWANWNKEKIMGFGHAIYKDNDPRNGIIKIWSERLAKDVGDTVLYPVSVRCEEVMVVRRNYSVTQTSSMHRLTTSWILRPSYSHQSS